MNVIPQNVFKNAHERKLCVEKFLRQRIVNHKVFIRYVHVLERGVAHLSRSFFTLEPKPFHLDLIGQYVLLYTFLSRLFLAW